MSKERKANALGSTRAPTKKPATQPYKRKDQKYYRKKAVTKRYQYKRTGASGQAIQVHIPDCTKHFIKALYDPFDTPAGVCIPCDLFPLPSQKCKALLRGSFNLGTTGFGFVSLSPSLCNDDTAIRATSSTSVGGASTTFNAYTNLGNDVFSKLPYSLADVVTNATVAGRIVAAGLRVRYASKETDRRGIYNALESGDHEDLYSLQNYNTVNRDYPQTTVSRPTGTASWDATVCYSGPIQPGELEFVNVSLPLRPSYADSATTPLIISCQGNAGDILEFEAVVHVEYVGKKVESKTQSHADTQTYGKVIQTVKAQSEQGAIEPSRAPSGFASFIQSVISDAPKLISLGTAVAESIGTGNPMPALMAAAGNIMNSSTSYPAVQGRASQSPLMIGYH